GAQAEDVQVKVWRTAEGATVLAGVPVDAAATAASAQAGGIAQAYRRLRGWLRPSADCLLLAVSPLGACALRSLDEDGGLLLLLAVRGEDAATRLPDAVSAVVAELDNVDDLVPEGPVAAPAELEVRLEADEALASSLSRAAGLGTMLPAEWVAWRDAAGGWLATAVPVGTDEPGLAAALAAAMPGVADMTSALGMGGPAYLELSAPDRRLTVCPAMLRGDEGIVAALTSLEHTAEDIAEELLRVVGEVGI
ncbi:MAG: hypothetical protein J7M38_11775, partial [Armatimonadetes bacterium]|nr:hypothetical protein [Armatimonadota bacterium]